MSGYYAWLTRAPSARSLRHVWLTEQIQAVHAASRGTYGSRRVNAELRLGRGIIVGYHAVELLMRRAGIKGLPGSRRPRPRRETPTPLDLVNRDFARAAPNLLWVTDITEHPTREGKVYCAVVLDTFSRKVVGWSIDAAQTATLVTNALSMAISNRQPSGTVIHSDHGVQFGSWVFTRRVQEAGLAPSMGSIGDCYDNGHDGVVLSADADRAARPAAVEDSHRAGQRDLRISGDLPQPATPPHRVGNAHPDRVREAPSRNPVRGMTPTTTAPSNPGNTSMGFMRGGLDGCRTRPA